MMSTTPLVSQTQRWNLVMRDCGRVNGSCSERFRLYASAKNHPGDARSANAVCGHTMVAAMVAIVVRGGRWVVGGGCERRGLSRDEHDDEAGRG